MLYIAEIIVMGVSVALFLEVTVLDYLGYYRTTVVTATADNVNM